MTLQENAKVDSDCGKRSTNSGKKCYRHLLEKDSGARHAVLANAELDRVNLIHIGRFSLQGKV